MTNSYSIKAHSHLFIARLTVETKTPLSIAAGEQTATHDNLIVRDANELPTIPGTSFAGVLRALYESSYDKDKANQLFGAKVKLKDDKEVKSDNDQVLTPSKVLTSWGCIHNADNKPIQGLLDPADKHWQDDPVLKDALQDIPVKRDHVKITPMGVADTQNMGKYDRVSLTAGHRFSLELSMWSETEDNQAWDDLLQLLHSPQFRLGGRTRSGLGKLEVIHCYTGNFALKTKEGLEAFSQLGQDLANVQQLKEYKPEVSEDDTANTETINLTLKTEPEGFRIGAGNNPIDNKSKADLITIVEKRILWANNKGTVGEPEILIPASSIKGVLRHRTAYYYLLFNKDAKRDYQTIDANKAVTELFGDIPDKPNKENSGDENAEKTAHAGKVLIDDIYISKDQVVPTTLAHNSIDRFTGGVREHMLYFEEVINLKQPFPVTITLLEKNHITESENVIKAFKYALYDLVNGRLAIGAGSGRTGTGYFTGACQWIEDITREIKGEAA